MAARKLRHEFYARTARERNISAVALAHHADDQVELFFLRLLRGAGGEGLAGMKWRSPSPVDGKITLIRPLLDAAKAELRDFARENKIRFREDANECESGSAAQSGPQRIAAVAPATLSTGADPDDFAADGNRRRGGGSGR